MKNRYLAPGFFIILILIGIFVYKDYGVGWDENIQRRTGLVNALYINAQLGYVLMDKKEVEQKIQQYTIQKNFDENTLLDYRDKDYGPFFELFLISAETLLNIHEYPEVIHLRHLLNYIAFIIGLIFFYLILKTRFQNNLIALLGSGILFLSPRIFAQSFYNSKDIIFMSFLIIALYSCLVYIKKKTIGNAIFHALASAVLIATRVPGIVIVGYTFILILIQLLNESNKKAYLKNILFSALFYITLTAILVVAFWPYLWSDPMGNFMEAFFNKSNFSRWPFLKTFMGERIPPEGPFYYIPVWILITTPLGYLALFTLGIFYYGKQSIANIKLHFQKFNSLTDTLMFFSFAVPFLMVIVFNSALYNGWRHMYFIYPGILYFSILGFSILKSFAAKKGKLQNNILVFGTICYLLFVTYQMVSGHPFQMVHFNMLAGKNINKNFDTDYWGMSYKQGLEIVLRNEENNSNIKIFKNHWPIEANRQILTKQDYKRITFVENIEDADYVISKRFYTSKHISISEQLNKIRTKNVTKFHDLYFHDIHLVSIYKITVD